MNFNCIAEICYKPLGDCGEDAFAYDVTRGDMHTLAVFDGCGGAGAWRYPEFRDATGAFVAAQTISRHYLDWFDTLRGADLRNADALAASFLQSTQKTLVGLKNSCRPMGVAGSLVKSFPCTASAAIVSAYDNGSIMLTALNVGDSRVYCLTPGEGLVQLTKDDSRGNPDPLDSLRDNAPLSNLLNADKPYKVRTNQIVIAQPCAVICATDGVFGFVRSPMDFEFMLLDALEKAGSIHEFEELFRQAVVELTGDDSVCLAAFYGWGSYNMIKRDMARRYAYMQGIMRSLALAARENREEAAIRECWESYKRQTVYSEMQE
ncbi:MAG: hypothetical protein E7316_06000 [Clostridiales bacterium]|nr:hypothetical protein [Clostridiales bacterium]